MLHDFIGSIDAVVSEFLSLLLREYFCSQSFRVDAWKGKALTEQSIQNLCDWDPVAVLTGNTGVYNDFVMSERKHMHFLVWREKKENEVGFCGSNKHTFPPKQTSLGTDWCKFRPQYWDSLKGTPQAFFPLLQYLCYICFSFPSRTAG